MKKLINISELSKNPEAIESFRKSHGLSSSSQDYLESLSFTKLKEQAKALNIRVPSNMRASKKQELINMILRK